MSCPFLPRTQYRNRAGISRRRNSYRRIVCIDLGLGERPVSEDISNSCDFRRREGAVINSDIVDCAAEITLVRCPKPSLTQHLSEPIALKLVVIAPPDSEPELVPWDTPSKNNSIILSELLTAATWCHCPSFTNAPITLAYHHRRHPV